MRRFLFALLCVSLTLQAQDRPNILWLTYEDTSPEFLGCYGNKAAKTPFMDFMAVEGVRFTRAFSPGSVCSPSRSALITGVKTYEMGTGNHRSNYPVPDYIKGFPKYLKDAGYYTSNNSKTDYNVANPKAFIKEAWHESSTKAGWWKREEGQPFFAVFNSNASHQSRTMTWPYEQYISEVWEELPVEMRTGDDDFEMPPFYRDTPEMRKQMARVYNGLAKTNLEFQALFDRLKSEGLLENTIIFCFADHGEGMPRMKTNGIGLGHRVPFTIWFPEKYKHLSPWGTAGVVTDEMIDFTDLAPTVLSLAGVEVPKHMKGRALIGENRKTAPDHLHLSSDRSDESYDLTRTVIKGKYAYTRVFMPYIQELRHLLYMDIGEITGLIRKDARAGLLDKNQRLLTDPRPAEFLFDLENDPWELNNLADKEDHKAILKDLREELKKEIIQGKDILFLPEYEIGQISQDGTAYEFRNGNYPIEEIYEVASLAGFQGNKVLKKQKKALGASDKICRYWALVGLRSQNKESLKKCIKALSNLLADPYAPNQILAASILYQLTENSDAKEVLAKAMLSKEDHLSNLALQQILYMENGSNFVKEIKTFSKSQKSLPKKQQLFNANRTVTMFEYVHLETPLPLKD